MRKATKCFSLYCCSAALLVLLSATSCGSKVDTGKDVALAVRPGSEVLVGPGPVSSCLDFVNYRLATGDFPARSISGQVIYFNKFSLQWTSSDTLYVAGIRYTVEGDGLTGGVVEGSLAVDEIAALLARDQAIVNDGPKTIESNDPSRLTTSAKYAPCGLAIGNLGLKDGNKTRSFTARVTIEVYGTAEDSEQNLRFVTQKTKATARYYGK